MTPVWQQYPATAALPRKTASLTRLEDKASTRTAQDLEDKIKERSWYTEDTFAGVYSGGPGWRVTIYGTTGFRLTPERDLKSEISEITDDYQLAEVREVDAGELGGYQRCGIGGSNRDDLVLCAWADHGSLAVATFSAGSLDESAETLRQLRASIITRD